MPETTNCRAAPALLIPLALQISRKRSKARRSRRVPDPRHRNEFPARQRLLHPARWASERTSLSVPKQSASGRRRGPASGRNRGRRLGSHFSGLAGASG
jgi:hypothetical protein